ncbi:mycofactocin system transcriptional regulator [Tsukamurella sp. 8F]|uniref:mycofactocin system transcriptional regulator n=1 Tax=unclassified Tsukamurella TaxID=2633480 RepID=UPI0023B946A5|nr:MULTISPECIES: mycofactocin system transcriptional regulator [unclassified Tsukamurella]MDF0529201.1 mycofactocin system transcriptional regulator [Tsukamurella sp. 8J]MDF0585386.1 mycofactocin system transcriptional regulator [Tsukamurella sp. 8F]
MSRQVQQRRAPTVGRPEVTSLGDIERAAFRLFADRGFEKTTMAAIAAEAGVSRRTLFRYYPSKNDIPWGQFDQTLTHLRELLAAADPELPLFQAVHDCVLEFNRFRPGVPSHIERMALILGTPALEAHSVLRYGQWRAVIAEYVAARTGTSPSDLLPRTVGHVSLALSLSAYETWLADPEQDLLALLSRAMSGLRAYLEA